MGNQQNEPRPTLVAAEQLRDWALAELPTLDLVWSRQLVRAMDAVAPEDGT